MNWYIGQQIIALGDSKQFKEGDIFIIKGLLGGCNCKGKRVLIDVGLKCPSGHTKCSCGYSIKDNGVHWCAESCFAPIDPKKETSNYTAEDLIKELELITQ